MIEMKKFKATVYYVGEPIFWNWNDDPKQPVASLKYIVGHPRLGTMSNVRTSRVVHYDEKTGTLETLNTIYKPLQPELTVYE